LSGCRKKCDTYISRPLSGKIETYFGVYKPGNWWVYKNKTGSKTDSFYLTNYSDTMVRNRTSCEEEQQRKFILNNTYLVYPEKTEVNYESMGTGISLTMGGSLPFFHYSVINDSVTVFSYPNNPNSHADSITINGQKYFDVLVGYNSSTIYYYGKNRGIVGWASHLDTFNLSSFRIL
jgi:hypothetical protein